MKREVRIIAEVRRAFEDEKVGEDISKEVKFMLKHYGGVRRAEHSRWGKQHFEKVVRGGER